MSSNSVIVHYLYRVSNYNYFEHIHRIVIVFVFELVLYINERINNNNNNNSNNKKIIRIISMIFELEMVYHHSDLVNYSSCYKVTFSCQHVKIVPQSTV